MNRESIPGGDQGAGYQAKNCGLGYPTPSTTRRLSDLGTLGY